MPVTGRKPKPAGQAVTRHKPTHDWTEVVDQPYTEGPELPETKPNGDPWSSATRRWWDTVRSMPHCTLWSPSDWMFAEHTARLVAAFDAGDYKQATEIRQREKKLGMTADDRRDLRIRYVPEAAPTAENVTRMDDYRDL